MAPSSKTARVVLLSSVLVCLATRPVEAAELKKEAAAGFDRYIGASEGRIKSELTNGLFLFIDELPAARRMDAYAQLREGKVLVKQVNTKEKGASHRSTTWTGSRLDRPAVYLELVTGANPCCRPGLRQSSEHLQTRNTPFQATQPQRRQFQSVSPVLQEIACHCRHQCRL